MVTMSKFTKPLSGSVVPAAQAESVSTLPTQDQISERAYEIYIRKGSESGHCQENWLEAEQELLNEGMKRVGEEKDSGQVVETDVPSLNSLDAAIFRRGGIYPDREIERAGA